MARLITRRRALGTIGGFGAAALLAACGSGDDSSSTSAAGNSDATGGTGGTTTSRAGTSGAGTSSTAGDGSCTTIPQETAGPFPGDGSNGPNVLNVDGVVRQDIRSSFGDLSGTADGIPLTIELTLTDTANGCAPFAGAAVYLWHCDAEGLYSLYSDGATDQNYLRGVQESDADGKVTFTSIYPGCYSGRWPHVHFEIYDDLAAATGGGSARATSQLAFPEDTSQEAYADSRYPNSTSNFGSLSLETDNVFSDDGAAHQLATMSGDASGYVAALVVAV